VKTGTAGDFLLPNELRSILALEKAYIVGFSTNCKIYD